MTEDEHVRVLEEVFRRLEKAGLRLKAKKCAFFQKEIEFLGHKVTAEGIKTDQAKVEKVLDFPQPTSCAEVRSFHGLASYYRKFIRNFAKISEPLRQLLKNGVTFKWTEACQRSFDELKQKLASAPVLMQPDLDAAHDGTNPFVIHTDASSLGLGAVLSQKDAQGNLHPIAYASKGCSAAEQRYGITDLEAAALIFGLRKFRVFIYGTRVIVRTDHQPLTALCNQEQPSARMMRWVMEMQEYQLKIEYIKGNTNAGADGLSRMPQPSSNDSASKGALQYQRVIMAIGQATTEAQDDLEDELRLAVETLRQGQPTPPYMLIGEQLFVKGNDARIRLVVAKQLRRLLFDQLHNGKLAAHANANKMVQMLCKDYFWPGMASDIKKWTKACFTCLMFNSMKVPTPPLKPYRPTRPREICGTDLLHFGKSDNGYEWVLVVIDLFTKWGYAYPLRSKAEASQTLLEEFFLKEGVLPRTLLSDNGLEYANDDLLRICKEMGVEQVFTKGYLCRENGCCERLNETLQHFMRKRGTVKPQWESQLPYALFYYNRLPHEATGVSPYLLETGEEPKFPGTLLGTQSPFNRPYYGEGDEYLSSFMHNMRELYRMVQERRDKYLARAKGYYDKSHAVQPSLLELGDRVLIRKPRERASHNNSKFASEWCGPYRVVDTSDNSAEVTPIFEEGDSIRLPYDHLRKIPDEVPLDDAYYGKTHRRGARQIPDVPLHEPATQHGMMTRAQRQRLCNAILPATDDSNDEDDIAAIDFSQTPPPNPQYNHESPRTSLQTGGG